MRHETFPRSLDEREREILDFLLRAEFPGAAELRVQAATASVVGMCGCGCASFDVEVDRRLGRAPVVDAVPVDARSAAEEPIDECFELLLWARAGWLGGVEIVYFGEPPAVFPPPSSFAPPEVRRR